MGYNPVETIQAAQRPTNKVIAALDQPYEQAERDEVTLLALESALRRLASKYGMNGRLTWRLSAAADEVGRAVDLIQGELAAEINEEEKK